MIKNKITMIKKYKFLIFIGIISLFFSSCSTVQKAFDPQRKNSSEEFLVEKKSPLSMPPDFNELPVPQNKNEDDKDQNKNIELESVLSYEPFQPYQPYNINKHLDYEYPNHNYHEMVV